MNWLKELKDKYATDRFFNEVFDYGMYKPAFDLGKVDTVLDIGALAGEFSFYIYKNAKRIYALEPDPVEYVELIDNITEYKLNKIKPFQLALSDHDGIGHLRLQGRGANTMADSEESGTTIPVTTITLHTFLEQNNIDSVDILKIDIESGEDTVFSAKDIDKALKKVKFICGEHGNLDLLTAHGFNVKKIETGWIATK